MTKLKMTRVLSQNTRKQVCEVVGVSISALQQFEGHSIIPSLKTAFKLAKFYGVTVDELFKDYNYEQN